MDSRESQVYEEEHVHQVYEQIAHHFSATRYKPWPLVGSFLNSLPTGSVGVDVGCGNGKYLDVNPGIFIIGSDRSPALAEIASSRGHQTIVADSLNVPHPNARFDFAISIAVIHHLSTPERRVAAIRELLAVLKTPHEQDRSGTTKSAKALVYVWALEQKTSRRGWDDGDEQDVMVPWVLQSNRTKHMTKQSQQSAGGPRDTPGDKPAGTPGSGEEAGTRTTLHRYYHLYRQGELERDVAAAGGVVVESGYEKDNWWAVTRRADPRPVDGT